MTDKDKVTITLPKDDALVLALIIEKTNTLIPWTKTPAPEGFEKITESAIRQIFTASELQPESIIRDFELNNKKYTLKVPILLVFEKLSDEGWENHIMATPLYDEEDLLGWEGIGYPGNTEAAEDFRVRFAESFQEYALADDSELTESGLKLKKKLLGMVEPKTKQLEDLFSHATRFTFLQGPEPLDLIHNRVNLEKIYSPDGDYWVLTWGGSRWDKKTQMFVHAPQPSSRTEDFINDTKFTLEEAYEIVNNRDLLDEHAVKLKAFINGGSL